MAVHLICFTSNGGLPIFNRKRGDCENLPFSTTASLNGVYMFCKSKDAQLKSTELEDGYLVWKEYEDAVTIIAIANGMTEKMLFNLTELVFNAFVMFIGTNDFKSPNIFERMKREAKNYIPIIDRLMEACDNELFDHTDCILSSENIHILAKLNEFSTQFGSLFCCIIINQKLSVATEGWWDLDAIDQKLLIALLNSSNGPQRDVPVFLPKKSPNTAYRFVTVPITNCATLCVICGAEPPYQEINLLVQQIWKNDLEPLQNAECCIPRNFPDSIEIDSNILGILLINTIHKKYVMSRNLQQSGKRTMSGSHRLDILRTFFYTAVDILDDTLNDGCVEEDVCEPLESYWCSEYHKCHAFSDKRGNLICVLYVASVPTYTMRLITESTLSKIIEEKSTCW